LLKKGRSGEKAVGGNRPQKPIQKDIRGQKSNNSMRATEPVVKKRGAIKTEVVEIDLSTDKV